tara:strand:- start:300 stop:884 length:585 start_codon:yes stop_codon:yes gene_type:complete
MRRIFLVLMLISTAPAIAATTSVQNDIKRLDKKLSKQADLIRQLKRENRMLKAAVRDDKKLQPATASDLSERSIFQAFQKAFKKGDQKNYRKAIRLLAKNYPNSKYFAEIYYMAGKAALAKKNYKVALRSFNKILQKYPKSSRLQMAKYSKAYTYQQMNLNEQASSIYKDLIRRYPDTSLAFRSNLQLKRIAKK